MRREVLACCLGTLLIVACGGSESGEDAEQADGAVQVSDDEIRQPVRPSSNGSKGVPSEDGASATPSDTQTASADIETLMQTSGCYACHAVAEQRIGPAYVAIAERYDATDENVAMLATKIIGGGAGNWGQIPMIAHPHLSQGQAEEMATFVLASENP